MVDHHAPSVTLPLRFVLTGVAALFIGMVWLAARPDLLAAYHYNQYIIALTHVFTLGWISSIIMGAMYQLVPVALETQLYSERLARWHHGVHVVGVAGMIWMFWVWDMKHLGYFGSVFGLGVLLFVCNLGRTLARIPRWNVIAAAIASALFWLLLTLLAGLYLAADKCWMFSRFDALAQMHAHAHLGGLGFFILMIVGVSYKLIPMFTLSELASERRAWWSLGLLNMALAGALVSILVQSRWKLLFALAGIAGLVVYGIEMAAILRGRKRRKLDWGVRYFLTAAGLLAPLSVLAVVLSWPGLPLTPSFGQWENVYGLLAFLGVVTLAILGMLYKIVPFLVWYGTYSRHIGLQKVPALSELYSSDLQVAGYWTYLAGLAMLCVMTVRADAPGVRWGCLLLVLSLAIFGVNLAKILRHLITPHLEPLLLNAKLEAKA